MYKQKSNFLVFYNHKKLSNLLTSLTQVKKCAESQKRKCKKLKEHRSSIPLNKFNDQNYLVFIKIDRNLEKLAIECLAIPSWFLWKPIYSLKIYARNSWSTASGTINLGSFKVSRAYVLKID